VVLVQRDVGDPVGAFEDLHRPAGDQLPGAVGDHGLTGSGDLGGRVLGVGVVDVPAGAVAQHGIADRAVGGPGEHLGVVPVRGDLRSADGSVHLDAGHVGVAHLVGELGGVGRGALDLEAAGVPQRG